MIVNLDSNNLNHGFQNKLFITIKLENVPLDSSKQNKNQRWKNKHFKVYNRMYVVPDYDWFLS